MTRTGERDLSRIGAIDYLLMTTGSCLAAFSGAMAIQQTGIALFSILAILIGAGTSYTIRTFFLQSPILKLDGYLYSIGIVVAFVFGASLQKLMPGGGYPLDVLAAGWLAWMLILGSFFTWQDSTLLFQAIPSVAMLGLVGVYDTFRDIRWAFFAFLLCLATLFARAHRRAMLRQAADSGYFTRGLAPGTPTPSVETTPGLARRMDAGPWRWIAGPEWALGSAFAVVLISLLGTPVIQRSVAGVAGFVKVPVPRSMRQRPPSAGTMRQDFNGGIRVGQGPNRLTQDPVLEVRLDHARYLPASWYDTYNVGRWSSSIWERVPVLDPGQSVTSIDMESIRPDLSEEVAFSLRPRKPMRTIPVPGPVTGWSNNRKPGSIMPDGRIEVNGPSVGEVFEGRSIVAKEGRPQNAEQPLPTVYLHMLDTDGMAPRVWDLAQEVVKGATTDYEKATRLRDAISRRIVYNIEAPAAPPSEDPVEYVLFTQKESYCDIYASAMTLMARAVGIPARYVVGYLPDESERTDDGTYVVLDADLHAWAELYFQDYGWVVFDATEGARSVPGQGRGSANDLGPFWTRGWFQTLLDGLLFAVCAAGIYLFVRPILARRRSMTPRLEVELAYLGFTRTLERATKTRRGVSRTPDEFLEDVAPSLGDALPLARQINDRYVSLLYSRTPAGEVDLARLRSDLRNLKQMLRNRNPERKPAAPR